MKLKEMRRQLNRTRPELKHYWDISHDVANAILDMRIQCGLTQEELAKKIGTKQESIARWEAGRFPRVQSLEKIAKSLGFRLHIVISPIHK